jgi:hypothetical protein
MEDKFPTIRSKSLEGNQRYGFLFDTEKEFFLNKENPTMNFHAIPYKYNT